MEWWKGKKEGVVAACSGPGGCSFWGSTATLEGDILDLAMITKRMTEVSKSQKRVGVEVKASLETGTFFFFLSTQGGVKCCSLFLAEAATNVTAKCSFATAHQTTAIMQISSVAFKEVLYTSILRPLTVSVWWCKRPSANKEQEGRKQVKTAKKVTNKQTSSMKTFAIMPNHMWLTGGNDHLLLMYCFLQINKSPVTL